VLLLGVVAGLVAPAAAASAEPTPAEIERQIELSSRELEKVVERYNGLNEELKASRAAAAELDKKLAPLQAQLDAAQGNVGDLAATAYKTGRVGAMSALLGGGSGDSLIDGLAALDHLARDRQREIAGYTDLRARYEGQRKELADNLAKQEVAQKEMTAQKTKIEADITRLSDMRRRAYGSVTRPAAANTPRPPAPYVPGRAGVVVNYAYGALGKPYVWGAEGPNGYDCSGLTLAAWRAAGVSLPHNAAMQYNKISKVSRSELMPGDLVFYNGLGHVALYVGNNQVIHAPTFGEPVKLAKVDVMPPMGYGRPG
jgi:cell wall-associated NlpC family hydrolase